MRECTHLKFAAEVDVNRLFDGEPTGDRPDRYTADVRIKCADCGRSFEFVGMPRGLSPSQPMMSFTGEEAHLPICPSGELPNVAGAGFTVTEKIVRHGPAN